MLDEPDEIRRAIARAVTDSGHEIRFSEEPARAGVNNLLGIYQAVTGKTPPAVEADFATARGYGDLKRAVTDVVIAPLDAHPGAPRRADAGPRRAGPAPRARRGPGSRERQPKLDEMKRRMGLILPA